MDSPTEQWMKSIFDKEETVIALHKDLHINKICKNGMTLLGAAAMIGNLPLLKLLVDFHNNKDKFLSKANKNRNKLQPLPLDGDSATNYKNIGYFVITRDEDNEFDGPTPEGMEDLEWDMEVYDSETPNNSSASDNAETRTTSSDCTEDMYRWYAKILNRTAILLDSPEKDFSRLDKHKGQSVLHYAVNSGSIEMVQYLLETFGKDLHVDQNDSNRRNCLHKAVTNNDVNMVDFLLKNGASVNAKGNQRTTPLHIAVQMGHHSVLQRLLNAEGINYNAVDSHDRSALNWALRHNDETAVNMLCKAGCCVNQVEFDDLTLLDLAVNSGSSNLVETLLRHGAKIYPSRFFLHKAILNNSIYNGFGIVLVLIKWGARVNCRDHSGYTPIMMACSKGDPYSLHYLIYKGANVNIASNVDRKTALHVCSQYIYDKNLVEELIDLLVDGGANMNATSYQGTPLLYSIIVENPFAAMALLKHGADVNIRDESVGWDVLSIAMRYSTLEICKMTVYAGFNLNCMSHDPEKLKNGSNDEIYDFIVYVKRKPLNLKDLCRIVIRNKIGSVRLLTKIKTLPLPTILHKYLSLEILE